MHQSLLSFNSGELSPYLRHRSDFAKHASGAERMENFLPLPYGAFQKRPGTSFVAEVGTADANVALWPFVAAAGEKYLLLFQPDSLTVLGEDGSTKATLDFLAGYDWDTSSYTLRDACVVQLNDVAFITHPACAPMRLSRLGDASWVLVWLPFTAPPCLDDNLSRGLLYSVAGNPLADTWGVGAAYTAGEVVFTSSEWVCTLAHTAVEATNKPGVGTFWKNYWKRQQYAAGDAITVIGENRSGTAWDLNPHIYNKGDVYSWGAFGIGVCLRAHTASAGSFDPQDADAGGPPASYWQLVDAYTANDSSTVYVGAYRYSALDDTGAERPIYKCKQLHSSLQAGDTAYPGTGATWQSFWEVLQITIPADPGNAWGLSNSFEVGVQRSRAGFIYECTVLHVPTSATEPGVGADWADVWKRVDAFTTITGPTRGPGKYFKLSPERDLSDSQVELDATTANNGASSPTIACAGEWDVFTFGTWYGTFTVDRSLDAGATWTPARTFEASGDRNVSDSGTEEGLTLLRVTYTSGSTASTAGARCVLMPRLPYITGYALCDTYVSSTEMQGHALTPMLSGATSRWAEGAFSDVLGYPRAMALHERRLMFAATQSNPVSLWASASDDFLNFATGTADANAIFLTLAASAATPIRWMVSQRRLILGTPLGEWVCGSDTMDSPLTPTSFQARAYTAYGSTAQQALAVGDSIYFAGRNGGRLWELAFSSDGYAGTDLSKYAEHLTQPGIVGLAWQSVRNPGLWAVRTDGVLLHLAFDKQEQLVAWSRHTTAGGYFRAACVIPSEDGDDEVFFVVDRGSGAVLEKFAAGWQKDRETLGMLTPVVDCMMTLTPTEGTFTVPSPLDSTEVSGFSLKDKGQSTEQILPVSIDTTATLDADTLVVGIPITSTLTLLPIDTQTDTGTTNARVKRATEMVFNVFRSHGGQVVYDGDTIDLQFLSTADDLGNLPAPFSGWHAVTMTPAHVTDLQVTISHASVYPFTCLAAVLRWQPHEP